MKAFRTTLTAIAFASFLALTGCSAGSLTGPGMGEQQADAPVQVNGPDESPSSHDAPVYMAEDDNDNTNGGDGSTDRPDGYNLSPEDD